MESKSGFKQIVGYLDRLHRDVGQLVAFVERSMQEEGWPSLPSTGRRITWGLSGSYEYPEQWRMPYASRFFGPEGVDKVRYSVFYLILLEAKSGFEFPAVLCGRVEHPALTEGEINSTVFNPDKLKSLTYERSDWQSFRQERGWSIAEPAYNAPVEQVRGYVLNLFDINDAQRAYDNIIVPLTRGDGELDLNSQLTVKCYPFPQLSLEA